MCPSLPRFGRSLATLLRCRLLLLGLLLGLPIPAAWSQTPAEPTPGPERRIVVLDPPAQGFYAKLLDYEGIPIRAPEQVSDEALYQARQRLEMMLGQLPAVRENLRRRGAELHIIGRNQVTSDLPEHRHLKGRPFEGTQTVDERTRGLGGRLTSCGEENLLRLDQDRYRGRDICVHEFAHNIYDHGMSGAIRRQFREQHRRSLDQGCWVGSYAGSNDSEFFAELSMWYWGTHGDLHMRGPKPAPGREGLRAYDPDACELFERFYGGKLPAQQQPAPARGEVHGTAEQ